jgi:hypothetical protein
MTEIPNPPPDPLESCAHIMRAVRSSGLTWGTQETPFSMFLTIRKRFLKNAKISPYIARPPTHTLGVDKGKQQYEQLLASHREQQLTIQNLESGIERMRNDLEGEVTNNEKLNNSLTVSKALVNNLNTKHVEAIEQANKSAKSFVNLDKTSKALKEAKEEVARLTKKNDESLKTISKLRETTLPREDYDRILQQKYHLEIQLQEADEKAIFAGDEVSSFKVKNTKLSKEITNLMLLLNNSKGCQDALKKQISDNIALDSIGVKKDESATSSFPRASPTPNLSVPAARGSSPKLMTKKEFKKLRQKTRKKLANMQVKEADDISEGDDDLNNSVEALIDPTKNQLDPKDNFDDDSNNNKDPLDKVFPNLLPDAEGNPEVQNVISSLTTIPVPAHPLLPDGMAMCNDLGRCVLPAAKADGPSNVTKAEDPNEDSNELIKASNRETTIVNTAPPFAIPSQYNPLADGMAGVPTKDPRTVNTVEREAIIKLLVNIVHRYLYGCMASLFNRRWPPTECQMYDTMNPFMEDLKNALKMLRSESYPPCGSYEYVTCSPCLNKEQCIRITSRELFKEITDDDIGNICKLFRSAFMRSVCKVTNFDVISGWGDGYWKLTPPWGVLGLGYSLRDSSFTSTNYSSHHALGTLADQLVRKGMLEAAKAGGEDHRKDGEADPQQQPVEAKPE